MSTRQPDEPQRPPATEPTRFKREGPEPASGDTGRDVDEMNELAEESLIRNVDPDQQVD